MFIGQKLYNNNQKYCKSINKIIKYINKIIDKQKNSPYARPSLILVSYLFST